MEATWKRQSAPFARGAPANWPANATMACAKALGAEVVASFVLKWPERSVDMLQETPRQVLERALQAYEAIELRTWAEKGEGKEAVQAVGGRPFGPWMAPISQLLARKPSQTWTLHHANALRLSVLGGYSSQAAVFQGGQVDSPECVLCRAGPGTEQHIPLRLPGRRP